MFSQEEHLQHKEDTKLLPYIITKKKVDGVDLLPVMEDTLIFMDYEECFKQKNLVTDIAAIYTAICIRENYYQLNTPSDVGDLWHNYYSGIVVGMLTISGMEESVEYGKIVIKRKGKKLLIIDKVEKPYSYYTSKKENQETSKELVS